MYSYSRTIREQLDSVFAGESSVKTSGVTGAVYLVTVPHWTLQIYEECAPL